jgi:hypothetical protein
VNDDRLQGDANLLVIENIKVMSDAGYVAEIRAQVVPYLQKTGDKEN